MRLDDLRRNVRDETDIPAEVERELEILDAALRGEEVPPGMEGIEALVSDLRAERQEPEPRFEEKLDAWAAAGFPRGKGPRARAAGGGAGAEHGRLLLAASAPAARAAGRRSRRRRRSSSSSACRSRRSATSAAATRRRRPERRTAGSQGEAADVDTDAGGLARAPSAAGGRSRRGALRMLSERARGQRGWSSSEVACRQRVQNAP